MVTGSWFCAQLKQYRMKEEEDFAGHQPSWHKTLKILNPLGLGFLGGPVAKNPPANVGDTGSVPGLGGPHVLWSSEA